MSERKVLNKYYPPDFDPTKIPKLKLERNRQYSIRIMAPFNMRCNTCGEYIYKGKKFNSRKETVEDENYLGLYIFRFYIKCPRCVAEIAFKTDPKNTDYALEDGATRNFEANRTAEEMAKREREAIEEEEKNNPMKVLENRTKASQREMEALEELEELRDMNSRNAKLDYEALIKKTTAYKEMLKKLQDEEDEAFIQSLFGKKDNIKRLDDDNDDEPEKKKIKKSDVPTDVLCTQEIKTRKESWQKSVGGFSSKSSLGMLVKKKPLVKKKETVQAEITEKKKDETHITENKSNPTPESKDITEDSIRMKTLSSNSHSIDSSKPKDSYSKSRENEAAVAITGPAAVTTPVNSTAISQKKAAPSALGLLGSYSDSEEGSEQSTDSD